MLQPIVMYAHYIKLLLLPKMQQKNHEKVIKIDNFLFTKSFCICIIIKKRNNLYL